MTMSSVFTVHILLYTCRACWNEYSNLSFSMKYTFYMGPSSYKTKFYPMSSQYKADMSNQMKSYTLTVLYCNV